jgi:hypothetical protein
MKDNKPQESNAVIVNIMLASVVLILFIGIIIAFIDSSVVRIGGVVFELVVGIFMGYTMIKLKK